ncbi:hypothetical protein C8R47DRAFT_1139919, partial [Mycena vitilis]
MCVWMASCHWPRSLSSLLLRASHLHLAQRWLCGNDCLTPAIIRCASCSTSPSREWHARNRPNCGTSFYSTSPGSRFFISEVLILVTTRIFVVSTLWQAKHSIA